MSTVLIPEVRKWQSRSHSSRTSQSSGLFEFAALSDLELLKSVGTSGQSRNDEGDSMIIKGLISSGREADSTSTSAHVAERKAVLQKRAWQIPVNSLKAIGMQLFMLYMSGTNNGIFSLLLLGYSFLTVVRMALSMEQSFAPVQDGAGSLLLQKFAFSVVTWSAVGYVGYKAAGMGLLPVHSGDFVGTAIRTVAEGGVDVLDFDM